MEESIVGFNHGERKGEEMARGKEVGEVGIQEEN